MWQHWALTGLLAASAVAARDTSLSSTSSSNDSLLWGLRPNVYFGVRPRLPKGLSLGLLWGRVEDFQSVQDNMRYTCEQHGGMAGYGWDAYDPRTGGVHTVYDIDNRIDIETSFVKFDEGRGGWGARIKGTPRDEPSVGRGDYRETKTAVWLHVSLEGLGSIELQDVEAAEELGFEHDVVMNGQAQDLGDFTLTITAPEGNTHPGHNHPAYGAKPLDRTFVHSLKVPEESLWQTKALIFSSLKSTIEGYLKVFTEKKMPPPWQVYTVENKPGEGNTHLVQKVFQGAFEFDVFYTPKTASKQATPQDLTTQIATVLKKFDAKYLHTIAPQAPFTTPDYLRFSKSLFSNLVGGIGYFHGDQIIDRSYSPEYEEESEGFWRETAAARARAEPKPEGPYELFTSVPSRPFFPRGFLWDEGFHLLPIVDWDPELCMQVVESWFRTMDEDGWIAREQILGGEARSKVPQEFQVQFPHYANPPTLFMVIDALLDKIGSSGSDFYTRKSGDDVAASALPDTAAAKAWFKQLYPLLQRNFAWYRRTQNGDLKSYDRPAFSSKEAYRWRGRSDRHTLTSGLDDYPRAQPPHPGELHTDLISWIGMMASSLQRIATYIDLPDDASMYTQISTAIKRNIDDLHWSKKEQAYCDATIDDYEDSVHVCHKGYISLFPFMLGLLPATHRHLSAVLDLIADPEELWSPFGIRSLSAQDEFHGTEENYWRSPIWINMNYLILTQLHAIATVAGPEQQRAGRMFNGLRTNLAETVFRSWRDTGFAWEQYNPDTGAGQRTQHFTGWTTLVVKIMSMEALVVEEVGGHDEL